MGLVSVIGQLLAALLVTLLAATAVFVDVNRLVAAIRHPVPRFHEVGPQLGVLVSVLVANHFLRLGQEFSWVFGWKITNAIYALEGSFVATVQSVATPWLTAFFAAIYLPGYVFLLSFPIVAYWALDDPSPLRELFVAYALNYGIGVLCYMLFVAYGPRNMLPGTVEPLLYSQYPQTLLLTSAVNKNTNVFPSLHAALATTVLLLAYRTRDAYPLWFLLTVPLAASVAVATLYLGIHWATDVVAGSVLAVVAVALSARIESKGLLAF